MEPKAKRVEDLTVKELYLLNCPRKRKENGCKGCGFRKLNNTCGLELPRKLIDVRKHVIPDWLRPALEYVDMAIEHNRAILEGESSDKSN